MLAQIQAIDFRICYARATQELRSKANPRVIRIVTMAVKIFCYRTVKNTRIVALFWTRTRKLQVLHDLSGYHTTDTKQVRYY